MNCNAGLALHVSAQDMPATPQDETVVTLVIHTGPRPIKRKGRYHLLFGLLSAQLAA